MEGREGLEESGMGRERKEGRRRKDWEDEVRPIYYSNRFILIISFYYMTISMGPHLLQSTILGFLIV
jgi:hypothetical protein